MDVTHHDIVLIGGGGAGLRAAIAAADVWPEASILITIVISAENSQRPGTATESAWTSKATLPI